MFPKSPRLSRATTSAPGRCHVLSLTNELPLTKSQGDMGYRVGLSCLGKGGIRNMEMGKWRVKEGGRARHRDAQLGPYEARSGGVPVELVLRSLQPE